MLMLQNNKNTNDYRMTPLTNGFDNGIIYA
jgi:hypothetical protein